MLAKKQIDIQNYFITPPLVIVKFFYAFPSLFIIELFYEPTQKGMNKRFLSDGENKCTVHSAQGLACSAFATFVPSAKGA